jgi:hypothetical protein
MAEAPPNRHRPEIRSHHRAAHPRRAPILAGLVVVAVAGVVASRSGPRSGPAPAAPLPAQPVAAPSSAVSSSWYCAGATASSAGSAQGTLLVANPGPSPLTARVTLVASDGRPVPPRTLGLPAYSRTAVAEKVPGGAPWVGATVVAAGGGVAVEQEVAGPLGTSASPCSVRGSTHWYFPTGTTLRDATDVISLYNPFPADAIVDLDFVTNQGQEAPMADQAVLVPAASVVEVDLGDHLRRRQTIATTVTATTGQVVAWQTQLITDPAAGTPVLGQPLPAGYTGLADPAPPAGGLILTLGAPVAGPSWRWPDGVAGNGVDERYVVYNPGARVALVRLTYGLPGGSQQPFGFAVAPDSVRVVATGSQAQVPAGKPHDVSVVTTNGTPVVAERTVTAVSPATRTGTGALLGSTVTARRWLTAAGGGGRLDEWVDVYNPGPVGSAVALSEVAPSGLRPLPGLAGVQVGAGDRVAVDVGAALRGASVGPLVVAAGHPVVVERDLYGGGSGGRGISLALAVPLG